MGLRCLESLGERKPEPRAVDALVEWDGRQVRFVDTAGFRKPSRAVASPGERVLYGSQVAAGPPGFVLFTGGRVPQTYARFLENRLRRAFGFDGVPIRFS